jgi:hypothetical protein
MYSNISNSMKKQISQQDSINLLTAMNYMIIEDSRKISGKGTEFFLRYDATDIITLSKMKAIDEMLKPTEIFFYNEEDEETQDKAGTHYIGIFFNENITKPGEL